MADIELRGLSYRYPGNPESTLSDLDLTVPLGEAHALLGGSGAGKTTLLNLLSGLLAVDADRVFFDGRDVGSLPPWERRVAQVFQFPVLYEAMTVAENLAFPLRRQSRQQQRARIKVVADRLGIDDLLEQRPGQLSLVKKQQVAIAKSLVRPDVSLVLLDEPLTAAEPEYKWQLRQGLKALQRDMGATMIYVTHDQAEALTFADRISVLHEGRILQTAEPEALVERPEHEHVGYFVGNPGMNFLDGDIRDGGCWAAGARLADVAASDGPCRIGFRPEWAEINGVEGPADGGEPLADPLVEVRGSTTLTTHRSRPSGLVHAGLQGCEIVTRQPLDIAPDGPGRLHVDRLVCYRDGWKVVENA